MKTLRELAAFVEAAAAKRKASYVKPSCMNVFSVHELGHTKAAQAVAAGHDADDADVAFVGSILFACWNDALAWAEARIARAQIKRFTCPRCGSNHYGSDKDGVDGPMTRYCHGDDPRCSFTFSEHEDHLYFKEEDDDG